MAGLATKVKNAYQRGGITRVLRGGLGIVISNVFDIPQKIAIKNQVAVRSVGLLDPNDVHPDTEKELVASVRAHVRSGEDVVVVGGGYGVSTVWNARKVGDDGSVVAFEPGADAVETVRQTIEMNGVDHVADVEWAAVGPEVSVRGTTAGADAVPPEDVPDCDVLEMDCDGAEIDILDGLTIEPRLIIVETHGVFGTPEDAVREKLAARGYEVIERNVHDEDEGIVILTAQADA